MKASRIILVALVTYANKAHSQKAPVVLENSYVRYSISLDGRNLGFIDRATGIDYLKHDTPSVCALVRRNTNEYPATSASFTDGRLIIRFEKAKAEAVIRIEPENSYIRLTVVSVTGEPIDSLLFLNIPLTLKGQLSELFGACAMSLNLINSC